MCFCNFARTGYFLTLKSQSVRCVIQLIFKDQKSPDHSTSNTKSSGALGPSHFCELNSTFNGNSHYKSFAIFLSNRSEFLSDDLVIHSLQRSKRIADEKKANVIRVKALRKDKSLQLF